MFNSEIYRAFCSVQEHFLIKLNKTATFSLETPAWKSDCFVHKTKSFYLKGANKKPECILDNFLLQYFYFELFNLIFL